MYMCVWCAIRCVVVTKEYGCFLQLETSRKATQPYCVFVGKCTVVSEKGPSIKYPPSLGPRPKTNPSTECFQYRTRYTGSDIRTPDEVWGRDYYSPTPIIASIPCKV